MGESLRHECRGVAAGSPSDDTDYAAHGAQSNRNRWPSGDASFRVLPGADNMATPADQRLLDLLDKWLKSLELHLEYVSLDDDSYSKIQAWPQHQRPSRWIIELAKQKALALHAQIEERVKMGDAKFSDSLELMGFLVNLVGAEHIERFIPLAHADEQAGQNGAGVAATGTREMPKFVVPERSPATARKREPATASVARTERKAPAEPSTGKLSPEAMHEQVIADAARLVQWGRKWYELAELISSMADRPSLIDVRRILKDNKTVIDKKAGRS